MEIQQKKTLVIGASPKPSRYSYSAVVQLNRLGHPLIALGLREDKIGDIPIVKGLPPIEGVHTVTLYVGPQNQAVYYDYILNSIKPKRIIFNPGTENNELYKSAKKQNIEVVEDCTLMMLSNGEY